MKKRKLAWLTLLFGVLVTIGCGSNLNDKERKIVGKWHCTGSEQMDDNDDNTFITKCTWTEESEYDFCSDHTEMDNGKVTFSFHVEDEDYDEWIDLIYDFSYEGTWRVKGNKLIQKGDKFIMEFSSFSTMQKYNPDVDDYYINALKSMMEEQIPELRHDNLKKRTQKIIDMSDDEMTVEENGEKTNMVRLK